jgi:hypothetical protein
MARSLTDRICRIQVGSRICWMTAGIALAAFAIRCIGIGGRWLTGDEL